MTEFLTNVLKRKSLPLILFFIVVVLTTSFTLAFVTARTSLTREVRSDWVRVNEIASTVSLRSNSLQSIALSNPSATSVFLISGQGNVVAYEGDEPVNLEFQEGLFVYGGHTFLRTRGSVGDGMLAVIDIPLRGVQVISAGLGYITVSYQGVYRNIGLVNAVLFTPIHLLALGAILFVIFLTNSFTMNMKSYLDRKFIPLFEEMENNVATILSSSNVYEGAISDFKTKYPIEEFTSLASVLFENLVNVTTKVNQFYKDSQLMQQNAHAKTVFLATMSHEIRTPLNGVIGFINIASQPGITDKERADALRDVKLSADGLLEIVNKILDISKIQAGALQLEKIPFSLDSVTEYVRIAMEPKAKEKNIDFKLWKEIDVKGVLIGDPTQLRIVLNNLLSNAIKFTNQGKVTLMISSERMTKKTIRLRFEVTDTGIGMTPDQLSTVFEEFSQADSGTTRMYGGTGLGLPLSKNIVEKMGGLLLVESVKGMGTKFSFEVNFDTKELAADETLSKSTDSWDGPDPYFKGHVLMAEDNLMNQKVLGRYLDRIGITYDIANNGIEAVARTNETTYDAILMDVHMPEVDGVEATRRIRENLFQMPIIMVTADVMSGYQNDIGKNHFSDYIEKPLNEKQLWNVLNKYFKRKEKPEEEVPRVVNISPAQTPVVVEDSEDIEYTFNKVDTEMLRDFLESVQGEDDAIEKAWSKKDMVTVKRIAHTIKGLSKYVDAHYLTDISQRVESKTGSSASDTHTTQEDIDKFIDVLHEYILAIEGYLEN